MSKHNPTCYKMTKVICITLLKLQKNYLQRQTLHFIVTSKIIVNVLCACVVTLHHGAHIESRTYNFVNVFLTKYEPMPLTNQRGRLRVVQLLELLQKEKRLLWCWVTLANFYSMQLTILQVLCSCAVQLLFCIKLMQKVSQARLAGISESIYTQDCLV